MLAIFAEEGRGGRGTGDANLNRMAISADNGAGSSSEAVPDNELLSDSGVTLDSRVLADRGVAREDGVRGDCAFVGEIDWPLRTTRGDRLLCVRSKLRAVRRGSINLILFASSTLFWDKQCRITFLNFTGRPLNLMFVTGRSSEQACAI